MAKIPVINKTLGRVVESIGGQTDLADKINELIDDPEKHIKQANVWSWLYKTGIVPDIYVLVIEQIVGGEVSRHELRPDLYPEESWCQCPACLRRQRAA